MHVRELKNPFSMSPFQASGEHPGSQLSFTRQVAALRSELDHLLDSFSRADSIQEQLQISSAINLLTSSIARLVRTHQSIQAEQSDPLGPEISAALDEVLKEWGRI